MKRSTQGRIIGATAVGLFMPFLWWLGGYNFDERGESAVALVISAIAFAFMTAACPLWNDLDGNGGAK